jgi:hypothetical protein
MPTLTEGRHPGGFLVWEAFRDYCREVVTIDTGVLEPGTVDEHEVAVEARPDRHLVAVAHRIGGDPPRAGFGRHPRRRQGRRLSMPSISGTGGAGAGASGAQIEKPASAAAAAPRRASVGLGPDGPAEPDEGRQHPVEP